MLLSQVLLLGFIYYGVGEDIIWNNMEKKNLYKVTGGIFCESCYITASSFAEAETIYKKEKSRAYNEGITEIRCKGEVLV